MLELNKIYNMDCIEWIKLIPEWSVDCVITDPPYWTTACKRDTVIPFEPMREQLKRIIKPNWAIVLFWSEPFSSALRMSNIKQYKYDWIWNKRKSSSALLAKKQPLRIYENIIVFWWNIYNPQMEQRKPRIDKESFIKNGDAFNWWWVVRKYSNPDWLYFPKNIIEISNADQRWKVHPTQKPVALIEYLVKTYTNEWEMVLDFTMWSWTTAIACLNTKRNFIWFELDKWYREIANKRLENRK